jgi:hypothetical protein
MYSWTIGFQGHICFVSYAADRMTLWEPCAKQEWRSCWNEGHKFKKGKHVSICKDRLIIMKWTNKKIFVLLLPLMIKWFQVWGQDTEKPKKVFDYNSGMENMDLNDAYSTNYRSRRKRLNKYYQKHSRHLIDICCLNSHLLYKKGRQHFQDEISSKT